jgi:phosphohistidine phosphatase
MSELCALLVIGHAAHARAFPFKKGGVAWLEGEPTPGSMLMRGFFPPAVLRKR